MTTKIQAEFLAAGIISDQTQVSAASADHVLIFDASDNSLKKALVSTITDSGTTAADDITAGDAAITLSTSSGNITIDNGSSDDDIIFKGTDGGSDITALTLDMSDAGTGIFNHDVRVGDNSFFICGAGDDVAIASDGTNGTISAGNGDLTLDVAGDIILDAAGNDIKFSDDGTQIGQIEMASSSFNFRSIRSDDDILFKGNDGGSTITALTLDMSDAGAATFNGVVTANAGVVVDNITIDGTSASISGSADFTIDSGGRIDLSADDNGEVRLFDGSSMYGQFKDDSDRLRIESLISDADMLFVGNDGGSEVTALTLDMSAAGAATFNDNVTAYSDERLKDNIETLEDGLDKVEQLRGVTYTRDERENIGVIAQEVEKILPEIVLTADDEMGTKSVDYSRLTAVLIEAVKELSVKVKELENK